MATKEVTWVEISNNFFSFLGSTVFLFFLKVSTLIILSIYTIFALMIVRQVSLMGQTLITPVSPIVKLLAIVHAFFALGLLILAVVIL